jgi:hypothetical protein
MERAQTRNCPAGRVPTDLLMHKKTAGPKRLPIENLSF